jgi:hypothetical protein
MANAQFNWVKIKTALNKIKQENAFHAETFMNSSMETASPPDKILSVSLALANVELEDAYSVKMDTSLITMESVLKLLKIANNTASLTENVQHAKKSSNLSRANVSHRKTKL